MKAIKYYLGLSLVLATTAGCKKDYLDTSFVTQAAAPAKLGALYSITQDNTGMVTIIPSGEGVTSYDVYFGDGGDTFVKVAPGKTVDHKYAEGLYQVKLVGHNIGGQTVEFTQALTVSFRAPENLEPTVTTNNLAITVDAKADYETMFHVYYGDETATNPEPFDTFVEGQPATHTYKTGGIFNVRIVALSGGKATTTVTKAVKVGKQIDLPLGFDDPNYDYTTSDFGGNQSTMATDPADATNKVMKVTKPGGAEVWAGTTLSTDAGFASRMNITPSNSRMTARVYSPAAGLTIKLKIEDHNDPTHSVETDVKTTKANQWETLAFDFNNPSPGTAGLNASYYFDKASTFFDFGTGGSGKVFYMDDLQMSIPVQQISLPVTFDVPNTDYTVTDFGNNSTVDAVDPLNASNKVKKTTKPGGAEVWAGTTVGSPSGFATKIPLTADFAQMTLRVYSPAAGLTIKLKVEDHTNGGKSVETDAVTTVANAWETLTFNFFNNSAGTSAFNATTNYDKASVFFDFGVGGSGKVFYWDDLKVLSAPVAVLGIPLDFQSATLNYTFTDFEGGTVTVVNNPASGGINTSTKVAKMVKNPGATYGGSYIALPSPIDFSTKKTFTMKVWSPRVGAKVLLKVENLTNGGIGFEKEVTTTKANEWELLTFDYSAINTANSYQKVVLIFDNGTSGDGSANYTFYFDDITLN
ncbi:hypothetical protein [Mucilaginibacter psychrotolerans]|uniref:PKD domain-containing protein n=1 Tax=Mucilaginibacter psychrotolerans TaxID=1524096 RepID=A0A4Y8SJI7_9SPHI|nr:hypothetical protein [Mucilaginibacter psychrotolerans]TFF38556.1 hypothetical protein E2R66_08820 [Mucilaginibacter psychrotolerans]